MKIESAWLELAATRDDTHDPAPLPDPVSSIDVEMVSGPTTAWGPLTTPPPDENSPIADHTAARSATPMPMLVPTQLAAAPSRTGLRLVVLAALLLGLFGLYAMSSGHRRAIAACSEGDRLLLADTDESFRLADESFLRAAGADDDSPLPPAGLAELHALWAGYLREEGQHAQPPLREHLAAESQSHDHKARRYLDQVLAMEGGEVSPQANRARALLFIQSGEAAAAIEPCLRRAASGSAAETDYVRALFAGQGGHSDQARAILLGSLSASNHPPLIRSLMLLGKLAAEGGRTDEARRYFTQVQRSSSGHRRADEALRQLERATDTGAALAALAMPAGVHKNAPIAGSRPAPVTPPGASPASEAVPVSAPPGHPPMIGPVAMLARPTTAATGPVAPVTPPTAESVIRPTPAAREPQTTEPAAAPVAGPAPLGPAPLGPAPLGPAPLGPAPLGPAPLGPAPPGPDRSTQGPPGEAVPFGPLAPTPRPAEPGDDLYQHLAAAQKLLDDGKLREAQHLYQQLLGQHRRSPEVLSGLGACALRAKRFQAAAQHYRAAVRLKKDYEPALFGLAETFRSRGDLLQATRWYRVYLRKYPTGVNAEQTRAHLARFKQHPTPTPTADNDSAGTR